VGEKNLPETEEPSPGRLASV